MSNIKKIRGETKFCTKCKQTYPTIFEHWGYSADTGDGLKCHCKHCEKEYNHTFRQRTLQKLKDTGSAEIALCSCGSLFNVTKNQKGKKTFKDICITCSRAQPLIDVYIPSLRAIHKGRIL